MRYGKGGRGIEREREGEAGKKLMRGGRERSKDGKGGRS